MNLATVEVEAAKLRWLAQFAHKDCGGAPRAENGKIICAGCGTFWPWQGTLAASVDAIGELRSLIYD